MISIFITVVKKSILLKINEKIHLWNCRRSILKTQGCPLSIARLRSLAAILLMLEIGQFVLVSEIRLHRLCYNIAVRY